MKSKITTKHALFSSVMSLFLCVAMLIGSTFAWFTDTASTGVNKIEAGTLRVDIVNENDESIKGDSMSFVNVKNETNILWEPGVTFKTTGFKIVSTGTLALKYKLALNGVTGDTTTTDGKSLLDVITFSVVKADGTAVDLDSFEGKLTPDAAESKVLYIQGHMAETANNDYQGLTLEGLGITVQAAQVSHEVDSKDDTYDKDAQYPDAAYVTVGSSEELSDAIKNATDAEGNPTNKVVANLSEGTYTLPTVTNKEVTITGTKDTVIDMTNSSIIGAQNTNLEMTLDGVTVKFANDDYKGITHSKAVTYKNCTITGKQFLYANEVEFIGCEFVQDVEDYNVWTYGAGTVLFKDCKFTCKGKAVLIYNEGAATSQTVEFQNCVFSASAPAAGKAAIEIDSTFTSYNVTIDEATSKNVTGFGTGSNSNNSVWNVKKHTKAVTVTVAGSVVYNQ